MLLQAVADGYCNAGRYDGNIEDFMSELASGIGIALEAAPGAAQAVEETSANSAAPGKATAEDESLLRDFITEGLEYIGEIELNILNLEQEPGNKDYINAIFRPFHSVKGVASFLNLDKIRILAHDLETLLDKARNEAIAVTPELIDLILDGSDTLKTMIGQLRDELEGREAGEEIDTSDIVRRIKLAETGAEQPREPKSSVPSSSRTASSTNRILKWPSSAPRPPPKARGNPHFGGDGLSQGRLPRVAQAGPAGHGLQYDPRGHQEARRPHRHG